MGRIAFLFPGQGAQHVGMGRVIADKYPAARKLYDQAADILGYNLARICFEGPSERLDSTVISQPALFVTSLAALEMLRAESPEVVLACEVTAGLSLGEYTALVFAGAMTFEDGVRVVQRRGEAMQAAADARPSGMVSVLLLDRDRVAAVCEQAGAEGFIAMSNFLCPGNIALSGENAACEKAAELAEAAGGRAVPLAVAGAFHTSIMQPADSRLSEVLSDGAIKSPEIPVVSNVDARPHSATDEIRDLLVRQVVSPVLWEDSIRWMMAQGVDEFYEIGPGKVLRGLLRRINRRIACSTINDSA